LTLYKLFGHPDSEGSVTTDPDSKTTEGILETETAPHWEETTKGPIEEDSKEPNTSETRVSIGIDDDVPAKNWEGYVFRVYYSSLNDAHYDFVCDNPNGIALNDQVYARNSKVESRLNIKIETTPHSTPYATILQQQYSAGYTEGDYDMVTGINRGAIQLAVKGHTADLAQYDEINIYRPYWEQNYVDSIMLDGSLYSILGDYSLSANLEVSSICFNKNLLTAVCGVQNADEPYSLVKTYEWTVDKLIEYMDSFEAVDQDKDGYYDWDKDSFAISGWGSDAAYGIFYGSGFTFCKNDGENLVIDYNAKLLDDIFEANIDIWCRDGAYFSDSSQASQHHMPFEIFSSGRGLFCDIRLSKIGMFLTEMEDNYGILPEPMFDKAQGQYYSYVGYSVPILLVPANDPNHERTGNIIEYICAESSKTVIPMMFEIVTKTRNVRDEESADMIDIIVENKIFDPAHWLDLSGYGSLPHSVMKETSSIASGYISIYHGKAETELNTYIDQYKDIKNKQ